MASEESGFRLGRPVLRMRPSDPRVGNDWEFCEITSMSFSLIGLAGEHIPPAGAWPVCCTVTFGDTVHVCEHGVTLPAPNQ